MIAFAALYLVAALVAVSVLPWIGWGILALNASVHAIKLYNGISWRTFDWLLLVNSGIVIAIKIRVALG